MINLLAFHDTSKCDWCFHRRAEKVKRDSQNEAVWVAANPSAQEEVNSKPIQWTRHSNSTFSRKRFCARCFPTNELDSFEKLFLLSTLLSQQITKARRAMTCDHAKAVFGNEIEKPKPINRSGIVRQERSANQLPLKTRIACESLPLVVNWLSKSLEIPHQRFSGILLCSRHSSLVQWNVLRCGLRLRLSLTQSQFALI